MRGPALRLALSLVASAATWACCCQGTGPSDPPDCAALANGPWQVGRGAETLEVPAGDSVRVSVTPGLEPECSRELTAITWTAEDASIATIDPLGPRNGANDTGGDIARAWITGLAPGVTMVKAVVRFTDGARDAEGRTLRVSPAAAPAPGSFVVAEGTAVITFNQFTGAGGSEMIPVVMPRSGRIDVTIDWTAVRNSMGGTMWEGACAASPCSGRLVIDAQNGLTKPQRKSAEDLAAGEYTLRVGGIGGGLETVRYEVRLTPN